MKISLLFTVLFVFHASTANSSGKSKICSPLTPNDLRLLENGSKKFKDTSILASKLLAEKARLSKILGPKSLWGLNELINAFNGVVLSEPTQEEYNHFLAKLKKRYNKASHKRKNNKQGELCVKFKPKDFKLLEDIKTKYQTARELSLKMIKLANRFEKVYGHHIFTRLNAIFKAIFKVGSYPPKLTDYILLIEKIEQNRKVIPGHKKDDDNDVNVVQWYHPIKSSYPKTYIY